MKKLLLAASLVLPLTTPAAAFEPRYVGQNSYWAGTSVFESDADVARQVAAFCRAKGFPDFAMGIRTTDIWAEQNFVCLHEGATAEPMYPDAGPAIIGVIPF